jgi:hypothetical protein
MDRKIAVYLVKRCVECPEALSAYQHTKAEAVLQRGGYRFLRRNASEGRKAPGHEAPADPKQRFDGEKGVGVEASTYP